MTDKELEESLKRINRVANFVYTILAVLSIVVATIIIIIICALW